MIAIPWLHVIREHPIFLSQYEDLFAKKSLWKSLKNSLFNFLKKNIEWIKLIHNLFFLKKNYWIGSLKKSENFDVIFVSHLLNTSQLTTEEDFYFHKVPHELIQQGHKVLIVLINHTSISNKILNHGFKKLAIPRVVISEYLPIKEEFKIWWCTKKQDLFFRNKAKIEKEKFKKKVINRARKESTSHATKRVLRIAKTIDKIICQTQAKTVITTYEGHAWERIIYATARLIRKEIKCIGYQHAALFRLQHAAKRSIGSLYDPELILTSGICSLNQMRSSNSLSGIKFDILGSKNYLRLFQKKNKPICMVLPEGILEEVKTLFFFSLECAKKYPEISFIWRLHPIINPNTLVKLNLDYKNIPSNIEISNQSFETDIARSRWALYRGSTAIISAAANGVVPIYLSLKHELTIDPLYEVEKKHPTIKSVDTFINIINTEYADQELIDYCYQFFMALNTSILSNELNS